MPGVKTFFDTNVLLYLLSEDEAKADRVEELLKDGGVISVQVLNEFAAVASRKLGLSWREIKNILGPIRAICEIEPVAVETHDRAIEIADRYGFSFYDATIVASALRSGCKILYSEDFQPEQLIANQLRIRNPFVSGK
ncbi:MAG: PIN domain-containing protein [Candidatus Binatia bacterium]